jgi:hypothetical protein
LLSAGGPAASEDSKSLPAEIDTLACCSERRTKPFESASPFRPDDLTPCRPARPEIAPNPAGPAHLKPGRMLNSSH